MGERVLIIDDDQRLAAMLVEYLRARGFAVEARHDLASGRAALRQGSFDALVLDLMLPDGDGLELCRSLRTESDLPVLMLTARGDPTDRVVGLELGADDYLPKPFDPRELLARLRAILRRRQPQPGGRDLLRFGRLEIDAGAREVRLDGQPRVLTAHQFNILHLLASSAGRVLSRDAIMDRLRGEPFEAFDRSVDVHVSRIRAAIEDDPRHPRRLLTVRGAGYVFARRQDDEEAG